MYGYSCNFCEGTVRTKRVESEAFKHREGFVILKNVTIGVCDKCGNRYYSADLVRRVEAIATRQHPADAEERVLVGYWE